MRRVLVAIATFAVVTACLAQSAIPVGVADGVRIDGRLDEAAWSQAPAVALAQQSPRPGAPSPYQTTVRVVADAAHLYFGFTCADPKPDRIALHTMQRDGDMSGDDGVALVLDTFGESAQRLLLPDQHRRRTRGRPGGNPGRSA